MIQTWPFLTALLHSLVLDCDSEEKRGFLRGNGSALLVTGNELDVLNTLALVRVSRLRRKHHWYCELTSGIVMVEMILRSFRVQRRRVLAF